MRQASEEKRKETPTTFWTPDANLKKEGRKDAGLCNSPMERKTGGAPPHTVQKENAKAALPGCKKGASGKKSQISVSPAEKEKESIIRLQKLERKRHRTVFTTSQ